MNSRTDRDALRTFFNETGGYSWRRKSGWEDGSDNLRNWEGVSINTDKRVIRIQLSENNLEGYIPAVIWNLTELEHLDLGKNQLTGNFPLIPENRLDKLAVLIMGNNKLTGLPDLHLFPNLKRVELQGNNIEGQLSEDIGRCEKLEYLLLSSNKLKGSLPRALGTLVNLSELDISKNKFSGTIPEECKDMRNLTVFNVKSNDNLAKPASAGSRKSDFYQWMMDQNLEKYLEHLSYMETAASSDVEPFPTYKRQQGVLLEGPHKVQTGDCLGFDDYADVLVARLRDPKAWPVGLGIFAQWGAGKSTLCEKIIHRLKERNPDDPRREQWFVQWLWTTSGGAVFYALAAGFITAVSGSCFRSEDQSQASGRSCYFFKKNTEVPDDVETGGPTSSRQDNTRTEDQAQASGISCCYCKKNTVMADNVEAGGPTSSSGKNPDVESIIASFDAWLYADSKVLWAVLISKIFDQVEECFGKGAVRATRVQHAISSSTCMDWFTVVFGFMMTALIAAAAVWVGELIARLDGQVERVLAGLALGGVPLAIVLWMIKELPLLFKSQGQIILSKAEEMEESVGVSHLGFMAEVEEEMEVLLDMLKSKSTEDVNYLLVVSIDNLDRCPHRQIVKVLEAVHLLLERSGVNVAVMLALDPRLIIAAIEKDMGEGMCQEVSGSEYLDKIIHWPFCIPGGTNNERAKLLRSWLQSQDGAEEKASEESAQGEGGSQSADQPGESGAGEEKSIGEPISANEREAKASEESAQGERGSQSADQPGESGGRREDKTSEESTQGEGGSASAGQPGESGAGEKKPMNYPVPIAQYGKVVPVDAEEAHPPNVSAAAITGVMGASEMSRERSYMAQTSSEVEELEEMLRNTSATPRKAKRVYNIYSIQRELAIKRAEKNDITFSKDDARKLLRWTIMAEFWPFYTACLAAIITREKQDLDKPAQTIGSVFSKYGKDFLANIFEGKPLSARNGGGHIDSYVPAGARRLMGMDEDYEGFFQLLASEPKIVVGDFDENKLGLLRLSINLNPAMVAKVTSWSRSKYN